MSQIHIKINSLRLYTRSLDERLANKTKYTDEFIDDIIDSGYELVSSARQPFEKEEVLDLTEYIYDGTSKFEVDMSEDVAGWKLINVSKDAASAINYSISPDNKVEIDLDIDSLKSIDDTLITFQYYYFPKASTGDQYMSTDIYAMVKDGIASAAYEALHDTERSMLYKSKLDQKVRTTVNGLDYSAGNVVKSNWSLV